MPSIYLAGKISKNDWRHDAVTGLRGAVGLGDGIPKQWPTLSRAVDGFFDYVGPYPMGCDHGCGHSAPHATGSGICGDVSGKADLSETQRLCFDAIRRADIVFAWVNDPTAYGTLVEIGYAKALDKPIIIAAPEWTRDLWFAFECATGGELVEDPAVALAMVVQHFRARRARTDSPIEAEFWAEHCKLNLPSLAGLVTQHPVGRYRLDFAIPERKFGIELDGYAYHSDKDSFVKDRARQRELEAAGWRIVRFAGVEIKQNVSACVRQAGALAIR